MIQDHSDNCRYLISACLDAPAPAPAPVEPPADVPSIPPNSKEDDGEDAADEPGIKVLSKKEKEKLKKDRDKVYFRYFAIIVTPLS